MSSKLARERPGRPKGSKNKSARPTEILLRRLYSVNEAAEILGLCRGSVYAEMRSGRLGYVRLQGGRRRVPSVAIDDFIEKNVVAAKA